MLHSLCQLASWAFVAVLITVLPRVGGENSPCGTVSSGTFHQEENNCLSPQLGRDSHQAAPGQQAAGSPRCAPCARTAGAAPTAGFRVRSRTGTLAPRSRAAAGAGGGRLGADLRRAGGRTSQLLLFSKRPGELPEWRSGLGDPLFHLWMGSRKGARGWFGRNQGQRSDSAAGWEVHGLAGKMTQLPNPVSAPP